MTQYAPTAYLLINTHALLHLHKQITQESHNNNTKYKNKNTQK